MTWNEHRLRARLRKPIGAEHGGWHLTQALRETHVSLLTDHTKFDLLEAIMTQCVQFLFVYNFCALRFYPPGGHADATPEYSTHGTIRRGGAA